MMATSAAWEQLLIRKGINQHFSINIILDRCNSIKGYAHLALTFMMMAPGRGKQWGGVNIGKHYGKITVGRNVKWYGCQGKHQGGLSKMQN